MGYRIVSTETFRREYSSIVHYIAEDLDSPKAAKRLMDEVGKAVSSLSDYPEHNALSAKDRLFGLGLREQLVRSYVIVYKIEAQTVYLMHMFHQSQDFERFL